MSGMLPLLFWLVKATALLMLATGVTLLLRRAPAGARYIVWLATLVALLLVPAISSWSPIPLPILPSETVAAVPTVRTTETPAVSATPSAALSASGQVPSAPAPVAERAGFDVSWLTVLAGVWIGVAALIVAWLLSGALAVRRIVRRGRVLNDESWLGPMYDVADRLDLEHAPRVVMSPAIEMPFACGILHPTIVLPSTAEEWSEERRRVVLFHELAHVRRRDLLGHTVGRIVCALYWFHPLVWSAAKRLRAESERACDDLVLACGGARASDYANHLLDIVTSVRLGGAPAPALPMADKKEFEGRMLAILDPALKRDTPSRSQKLLLTVGLGAVALSIAAVAPTRRTMPVVAGSRAQSVATADTTKTPSPSATPSASPSARAGASASASPSPAASAAAAPVAANTTSVSTAASQLLNAVTSVVTSSVTNEVQRIRQSVQDAQGIPADTALLGKILRTDRDPGVRRAAAWALQGRREGVPLLLERLRSDPDEEVREMSAWALVGLRAEEIPAALAQALKTDKSQEVRATAAWGLGNMRAETAALEAAMSDPSAEVRQRALWALGQQGMESASPRAIAMLKDDHSQVRLMAAWYLGQVLDKASIPALREAFAKETDDDAGQAEFRALIFMGDRSQAVIDRAMSSENSDLRARAVRMIAGHGPGIWPWPWPWPQPRPEP